MKKIELETIRYDEYAAEAIFPPCFDGDKREALEALKSTLVARARDNGDTFAKAGNYYVELRLKEYPDHGVTYVVLRPKVFYTTSPEAYDGFGTKTVEHAGIRRVVLPTGYRPVGEPVRKIEIPPHNIEWQTARNHSGCYPTWTPKEFEEQVKLGYIVKAEPKPE